VLFGLFTAIGLLFFTSYYLDDLARLHAGTLLPRFIEEMTGSYTVLALLPGVRFVVRRFPPSRRAWVPALAAGLAGAAVYTVAHTTLMALSRALVFPLAGLGAYDYGIMVYRYPMEAAKDVMYYALIYGTISSLGRLERGRAAELAAADLQTKLAQATLENLRLQLHPHFLFNTLNAISAVMYEDVAKADAMLAKLSDFLRVVLESGGPAPVALAEEIAVEQMYVDIMRTRLERQLSLTVRIADDAHAIHIPLLLLQPLLENSIRHGLAADGRMLEIDVGVRRDNGSALVEVSDNGIGYRPGERRGHGLRNVESRLRQTFGAGASFSIGMRAGGGTHVALSYPLPPSRPT